MAASLDRQIREAVTQYIAGRLALRQFQEWFASHTWNIDSRAGADDNLRRLANDVDLLLAEFSSGHWTEQELKDKLREHRSGVVIHTSPLLVHTNAGSRPGAVSIERSFNIPAMLKSPEIEVGKSLLVNR